jgi:tetratricopeptide (TPR) repeat protein
MDKTKSGTTDKSSSTGKAKQEFTLAKDATARRRIKMVQNVLLIWLDSNIDDNDEDCRNTVNQLRRVVNTIDKFTDGEECVEFIESMIDEKACMIISGSLGEHIVPRIHDMSQVDSIFIFCGNKKRHEQWSKAWPKIKGIFTEISPICEALKQASQQCEQNAISISFVATSGDASTSETLDQLDPTFMYTQIMKEILLTIRFSERHIKEFIDHCRVAFDDNKKELKNVDKLEKQYRDETPIWWYTYDCFLYPMLNRSLRLLDVDIIIKMGFFINDLHRHIEKLHKEQFSKDGTSKTFMVYRGQGLSKAYFDQLMNTKGGLMSFNSFLSTSKDRNVSLSFAHGVLTDPDSVGILFVMTIDPSKSKTPFASILNVSYYKEEDEVLFSMHTVFRIHNIKSMGENHRLFQVELTLTSDNDKDLRALTDRIREETFPDALEWDRLGVLLLKMGQSGKAQQVYEAMLSQTTNDSTKGFIYERLGTAKKDQGEFKAAITFYEKSLEIYKKTLSPNDPNLASSYNNIGLVYDSMGEFSQAVLSHEKALEIKQRSLSPNHPSLASSYNNIGLVYNNMGEYSKALSSYEKALEIKQKSLPSNHPSLAMSYANIGGLYNETGEYTKALPYFEKAHGIFLKTLPPNHPDLASFYANIGCVYQNIGEYSKARSFYERAVDIGQRSLPSNHSQLQEWKKKLEDIKKNL